MDDFDADDARWLAFWYSVPVAEFLAPVPDLLAGVGVPEHGGEG